MGLRPDLADQISQIIKANMHQRLQNLTVEVESDTIILRGSAGSFYVKQLAQHCVLDRFPGTRILNAIEVASNYEL